MKTRLLSFGALLALVASMTISWSAPALAATGSTAIPAPPGGSNPDLDALDEKYFKPIYEWFADGGYEAVAYYLRTFDLSDFSPTAPPKKTEAWYRIVRAWAEQNKDAPMVA